MPSSPERSVVLSWNTRNWKILPLLPTACTVIGWSNTLWGEVWQTQKVKQKNYYNSSKTTNHKSFHQVTVCFSVDSYPVKFVCTGQSIPKGEHNHLSSELLRVEPILAISWLQKVKRVGMRVTIVTGETWIKMRHQSLSLKIQKTTVFNWDPYLETLTIF